MPARYLFLFKSSSWSFALSCLALLCFACLHTQPPHYQPTGFRVMRAAWVPSSRGRGSTRSQPTFYPTVRLGISGLQKSRAFPLLQGGGRALAWSDSRVACIMVAWFTIAPHLIRCMLVVQPHAAGSRPLTGSQAPCTSQSTHSQPSEDRAKLTPEEVSRL